MSANLDLTPYTVHVTYGEAVQFLTSLAEQGSEYTTMATAPLISWLFPAFAGECLQARDTIMHVARPLLQEMTRHRLPLPESADRPADDTPLQLQLSAGSWQLLAELGPLCLDTWQGFIDLLETHELGAGEVARMKQHRKNLVEGTAALLAAMAAAGVPTMPTA